MKKILLLLLVGLIVFVVLNKQRLYLRDPIATVERDDITVRGDVRVMINYNNDVFLDDLSHGKHRMYLLQHWNRIPGLPGEMKCLTAIACLADADQATTAPIRPGKGTTGVSMSDRVVQFVDEDGAAVKITLR